MRGLNIYCVVLVLTLAWVSTSHAQDTAPDTAAINRTVEECLKVVRSLTNNSYFDAFYNPATHKVENNVRERYGSGQTALYQFNKCMAQHGVGLKY